MSELDGLEDDAVEFAADFDVDVVAAAGLGVGANGIFKVLGGGGALVWRRVRAVERLPELQRRLRSWSGLGLRLWVEGEYGERWFGCKREKVKLFGVKVEGLGRRGIRDDDDKLII